MNNNPWIEKYRPQSFEKIVLDSVNKRILNGIIDKNYFPNLLFYGPPGTGKTTTIINLIKKYEKKYKQENKGMVIHLNASDDRGIDIIRNQIYQFVNTKSLFGKGTKFVILDEADYMTKNAQTALRDLIQNYNSNVRFCLICNYISRIDKSLQNEFVKLHFCNLPENQILNYLNNIILNEGITISQENLISIQKLFNSDIRSMVNYIQTNQNIDESLNINIITNKVWEDLIKTFYNGDNCICKNKIKLICKNYKICIKDCIKQLIQYLLDKEKYINSDIFVNTSKFIIKNYNSDEDVVLNFFVLKFLDLHNSL
tara:strand:+ start:13813 stop:14751 length:939 start_codon:yes stop_codon:yes gene_type:complete